MKNCMKTMFALAMAFVLTMTSSNLLIAKAGDEPVTPDVILTDSDVNGTESYIIDEALPAGTKVTVNILSATSSKDMAMWLIGSDNFEYTVWGWGNFQTQPTLVAEITSDIAYLTVLVRGIDGNAVGFNYTIEKPIVEEPEEADVTIADSDVNGEEVYIIDEALPTGTKVTVDIVSATSNKDMAMWLIGSDNIEYAVWGWGNFQTKPTLEATINSDIDNLKVLVRGIDGNTVGFNYTIEKPIVEEPEQPGTEPEQPGTKVEDPNAIVIKNEAGTKRVEYTVNANVKAGQEITFDFSVNKPQDVAIWLLSGVGAELWCSDWQRLTNNEVKSFTIAGDKIKTDMSSFKFLIEFNFNPLAENEATISNLKVAGELPKSEDTNANTGVQADASATEKKDKNAIVITNEAGNKRVEYTVKANVKAGKDITFDFSVNKQQDVAIWLFTEPGTELWCSDWQQMKSDEVKSFTIPGDKIKTDMGGFKLLIEYNYRPLEENVATITNLKVAGVAVAGPKTGDASASTFVIYSAVAIVSLCAVAVVFKKKMY